MAHAASFAWASMLPPRPLRWASRLFGIYLSVGSAAAVVSGIAGVVPGSPLRTLMTAPAPDLLAAPAAAARPATAPAGAERPPEPADTKDQIAQGSSNIPLRLADASIGTSTGSPATDPPATVSGGLAEWRVQVGAFRGRSEAVTAANSTRSRIGAGQALVTEKLGQKTTLYLAEVDGLTVPQARVACGASAGSTCLIFAPTEPVPPDLLPPD